MPLEILRRIALRQDGMVTTTQALAAGLTRDHVRQLCRSGRWMRLSRGCYAPTGRPPDAVARRARIRAAVTSLGPDAFAVLDSALLLHDIAGPRRPAVHVSVPVDRPRPQRHTDPTLVVHQFTVAPGDLAEVDGILTTSPLRTVTDMILRLDRYPAVSVLDSALNRGLVTPEDLASAPTLIRGRRGAPAARSHLAEVDGRAQSPLETWSRLRCVDGGVPPDTLQQEVRDEDGHLLGIGDLGWRAARLIAEADGAAPHGTPEALFADRRRQNRLINAGWRILRFTWSDALRPDYIPHTVRQAMSLTRTPPHPESPH
ncbi:type IV toxin-antitoxin system AbiEi family antitoxin domain-containing protein [Micromonospora antibiotica]|uniref:Type IV toxin-antitoxin system AbiEi family antitoxin domain-containing protein n=1 Tax=Micromonospora antibiotica TaxID=2807623 RepID=A0ABS3V214_9ACTN|nr:type IV toxin-antitoxin system AbiEi family antitoxin domain-containing protein [Micromonospora antibiotica]MBO4159638.1 type IV toxin-antitoxin system AbiEi family antitoxin domain-containing protein [Micromonospora antibiotica]